MTSNNKHKLAIIMRTDLGMTTGKMCVQAGHASVLAYDTQMRAHFETACDSQDWLEEGQFKVVLRCPDNANVVDCEQVLLDIANKSRELGLPVVEVCDEGFTQVAPETLTCIAIGPALCEEIDKIIGGLSLL